MSARTQWRYIAWTRAIHSGEKVRTFLLDLSRRLDRKTHYPLVCRVLDRLAGGFGPAPHRSEEYPSAADAVSVYGDRVDVYGQTVPRLMCEHCWYSKGDHAIWCKRPQ